MAAPYAGAPVSREFHKRWLNPQKIGDDAPVAIVEVRRGRLNRTYHDFAAFGYPAFGEYPGALSLGFWYPDWQPNSAWRTLDGITNITLTQSFSNNGVTTATIAMDNLKLVPTTGPAGALYHAVEPGYYSPLRGYVAPRRPDPGVKETPFLNMLPNAQIRIRQGYGADAMVTTFLGLIDDVESDSVPNQLNITARDFGGVLVDEKFFGWAKELVLPSPVTFANRAVAEHSQFVGGNPRASSHEDGHSAFEVAVGSVNGWRSAGHDGPYNTEWIEITIPAGKYSNIYINPQLEGMRVFVGIRPTHYAQGNGRMVRPSFNGNDITVDGGGWWDPYGYDAPGVAYGGWPYFATIEATKSGDGYYVSLGGEFLTGDDTRLRLGFRNLGLLDGSYRAGLDYFQANQRSLTDAARVGRYVIIDDVSDIVRCCLRWAGFKNWEIENTGTDLGVGGIYTADASKSFMDVINTIKDMVGYTFFIGEPRDDSDDQDLGWPIFRNNRVMEDHTGPTEHIDDSLLLTDAKVTLSNQDDHCIIRCRGIDKATGGVTINNDTTERVMYAYIPPWANEQGGKQAGVLKPINHHDEKMTRLSDCQFGCYLIALQIGLLKYTVILDLPANPGIGLDTLQSVIDRTQGLNSRVYVSNRTQTMDIGSSGHWTLELGGSLVDTPEVSGVLADYRTALKDLDRGKRNPWLRKRAGKLLDYGYQTGGTRP